MLPVASLDGQIAPAGEMRVPVTDDGLLRGDGVFEMVRLHAGRPFAWEAHLDRMRGSAARLKLDADLETLEREATALIEHAGPVDAGLRLVATRGGRRLAIVEPLREQPASVRLATVTYAPTRLLDQVKSLSYAANMLATRTAQAAGADDALLVTPHGRVLEAPTASILYARDGTWRTPPLDDHVLDSITRRLLLPLLDAHETVTPLDDLLGADEVVVVSTLRDVLPVHAIDGTTFAAPGPMTSAAQQTWAAWVSRA